MPKFARHGAIGITGAIALAIASFVLAPGTWLTEVFIAPGVLLAIAGSAVVEALLPASAAELMEFFGEGPTVFVGLTTIAALSFWAVAIAAGSWWVANAPEGDGY